jgi:hypothetical protein
MKQLSSDSRNCPLCSAKQTSCGACRVISCSNGNCDASSAIPIVNCCIHHAVSSCTSCLEPPPGSLPRMGQCPVCTQWFCSQELRWCIGRPVPDGAKGDIDPSSSTVGVSGMVARLHPTRAISCQSPACKKASGEGQGAGGRCIGTNCWSGPSPRTVCRDCTTQDSFSCPCGRYWNCGSCGSQSQSQSSFTARLITCPRCRQSFCPMCMYIGDCELCGRAGLCNDCVEEEESVDAGHTQAVNIITKCRSCEALLCEACTDDDERFCGECDQRLCKLCEDSDVCDRCRRPGRCLSEVSDCENLFSSLGGSYHLFRMWIITVISSLAQIMK